MPPPWGRGPRAARPASVRAAGAPAQSGGPVRLALASLCTLGLLARVASQCANMKKDPHLAFARGGRADFRGRNGAYYCVPVHARPPDKRAHRGGQFKASYRDALTVDGSFITEVHAVALVGGEKHKLATASFWTSELNEFTTGPNMINGTCGDRGQFFLGTGGYKTCEELEVAVKFSSAKFRVPGWTIKVAAAQSGVASAARSPARRVAARARGRGGAASDARPGRAVLWLGGSARDGKRDLYPSEGRFRTSAMAEGAIEGNAAMYELAGPLATEFPFSRFREAKKPVMLPLPAGAATVDASSTDQVEVAGAASAPPDERRLYEKLAGVAHPCAPPSSPPPTVAFQRDCSCSDEYTKPAWVLRKRGLRECLSRPQRVPLGMLPAAAAAVVSCRQHGRAVRAKRARRLWRLPRFVA